MRHVATISKAHNYLRIYGYYGEFKDKVIIPFCRKHLYKWGKKPDPDRPGKQVWKVSHVFARSNHDKTEYRIPGSLLKEFLEFATYRGYNPSRVKQEDEPVIKGKRVTFKLKEAYKTPREDQVEWINYQLDTRPVKVNNAATGQGKALIETTPVRVPGGWKQMKELQVGDHVLTVDGSYTPVTGVYPQGVTPTLKVTFEDGRTAVTCPEHLWLSRKGTDGIWEIQNTAQMMDTQGDLYIPLGESEKNPDKATIIEPYLIGWTDRILGDKYLEGSTRQRLALLQGLLDHNAHPKRDGSIVLFTPYERTAKIVQQLVWSLGGIARYKGKKHNHYVYIKHKDPASLFTLDEKVNELVGMKFDDLALKVTSIESSHPARTLCISVAHESRLYVIKDYVVTHNTYMSLYTMVMLGMRTIVTIQPRYITTWLNDIDKMIETEPGDVVVWEQSLQLLGDAIEQGRIDPKIIILPTTRISLYLRNTRLDPDTPCLDHIMRQIQPGFRILDEGHESFHEVCLSMLYGNLEKFLLLSATLTSDDPFMNQMYKAMLPISIRLKEPDAENYIDIFAYLYQIDLRKFRIKTQQFGSYNDMAVEQSILNDPVLTNFYFEIADKMFQDLYLDIREEGTKCLFFFSLIKMCQVMKDKFLERYPGWDFETYLGTLDKKTPTKYLEHEIVITTPGSCGTGKDIPGLVTNICFHTVFSIQRNKQMIGRLRDLRGKFGGRIVPRFGFPVCVDIEKHRDCEKKRRVAFAPKQSSWKTIDANLALVA